jgi:iron complex outermembrane recepter protein
MIKKTTLIIIGLFLANATYSQNTYNEEFLVLDKNTKTPIEDVLIAIYKKDSLVNRGSTDGNGSWSSKLILGKVYQIKFSHIAYEARTVTYRISGSKNMTLSMVPTFETQEDIIISGTRIRKTDPGTTVTITKKDIKKQNSGKDMPYVLEQTPSVVTFSDAGAGVGYTGMRIRGVDATRINVTLNGIPYNDAEAHGVFWVDMPDLASSVNSIQIQRGVGTSTNGSASFGASVNLKTDHINKSRFGSAEFGLGSFGTRRMNVQLGSGVNKKGWGIQGRASLIQSDGFVDRASSDLYSAFVTAAHYGKKSLFKVNAILGKEITYQSWAGTPMPKYEGDDAELQRYIGQLWIVGDELNNLLDSDPATYNSYTYENQVDNYTQNHFQAFYSYLLKPNITLQGGVNYTRGLGYYEEAKNSQVFSNYGLANPIVGSDTFSSGKLIRRRWLDNHFYGGIFSINYDAKRINVNLGGGQHFYNGGHYGNVIWQEFSERTNIVHQYYNNDASKNLSNLYAKTVYNLSKKVRLYGDLQLRRIMYSSVGLDNGGVDTKLDVDYTFFNPKAGIGYAHSKKLNMYASYGRSNREPVRSDLINSSNISMPKPEQLDDYELGLRYTNKGIEFSLNGYFMDYKDQLVLTGKINDVGASTRENVSKSYRKGIETMLGYKFNSKISLFGNLNVSQNEISEYTEYIYSWTSSDFVSNSFKNTTIAFSPKVVTNLGLDYELSKYLSARVSGKYISEQFLDNTGDLSRALDAYSLLDASLHFHKKVKNSMPLFLDLFLYNLGNTRYAANGYTFSTLAASEVATFNYVFPQAGFHFMLKAGFRF